MMANNKKRLVVSPTKISLAINSISEGAKLLTMMGFDIMPETENLFREIRKQIIQASYEHMDIDSLLRKAQTIGDSGVTKTFSSQGPEAPLPPARRDASPDTSASGETPA